MMSVGAANLNLIPLSLYNPLSFFFRCFCAILSRNVDVGLC